MTEMNNQGTSTNSNNELVELVKSIGDLTHEINNPLSTIKLNLKLMAEDFANSNDDRCRRNYHRLQRLEKEIQRLQDFIMDFRNYVGKQELQLENVDLRDLIEELTDFYRPQAEHHHIVLRTSLPAEPVNCMVDPGMIKQALLNLMTNATQAMSDGGELLLKLSSESDRAVIEVIDTGPGIEPGRQEKIFQPYYTTTPGGTGLGLPTTRRIVLRHKGRIYLDSEPGKGTRFVIELPLKPIGHEESLENPAK